MAGECVSLNKEEVEQFLSEREKANTASGARVVRLNKETEKLEKEVKETDSRLRLLL